MKNSKIFFVFGLSLMIVSFSVGSREAFAREKLKATTKTQGDFNLANRFTIEIDGIEANGINSVEGIESESEVVEYKDGEDGVTHTRPGNHKPGKIMISRDWSNTSEFRTWRKAVLDGKAERKSVSVIFHNDAGEEAGRMNFFECWPSKLLFSDANMLQLNSRNSGHASEKVEFVCDTEPSKSKQ